MILKILKNIFFIIIIPFLISCGGSWENFESAVGGKKKSNQDEFLIENKDPLTLPPDYQKLPLPDSEVSKNKNPNSLENILTDKKSRNTDSKNKSNLEKMIEQELRERN